MFPPFEALDFLGVLVEPVLFLISPRFRQETRAHWANGGARRRIADVSSWILVWALLIAAILWISLAWLLPKAA